MQTTQLTRKNVKKKLQKANITSKTPDFAAISSKNRAETPKKFLGKIRTRLKLAKAGKKLSNMRKNAL